MFYLNHQWQKLISSSKEKGKFIDSWSCQGRGHAASGRGRRQVLSLRPQARALPGLALLVSSWGPPTLGTTCEQDYSHTHQPGFHSSGSSHGSPEVYSRGTGSDHLSPWSHHGEALGVFDRASTCTRWEKGTSPRGSRGQSGRRGEWGLGKHWVHSGNSCGTLPWTRCWRCKGQEAPQSPPGGGGNSAQWPCS